MQITGTVQTRLDSDRGRGAESPPAGRMATRARKGQLGKGQYFKQWEEAVLPMNLVEARRRPGAGRPEANLPTAPIKK